MTQVFKFIAIVTIVNLALVNTRRPRLRQDATKPPRDYRPSKWLANSAMDVWYGNKSFVEILSREFNDIVDRIAIRPVRNMKLNESYKGEEMKNGSEFASDKQSIKAKRSM